MFKLERFHRGIRDSSHGGDTLTVTPGIQASVHHDGIVLLHIPTGKVFQSNRTGARIWHGLSGGLQPDIIATEISRDYGVPQELAARDTATFLTALEHHGFVTRTGHSRS